MTTYKKDNQYFTRGSIVIDDVRIFNPTHEQLLAAGWVEYVTPQQPLTTKSFEAAVENYINKIARENEFDSIQTCTKYNGFENPFEAKAKALLIWNSQVWVACRTILSQVQSGIRPQPTIEELISELPEFELL